MGAKEAGGSFLAGVYAKLPESVRAQVQAAFEAPEAADAVTLIGDGVLARSDYSKQMDSLATQKQELQALYDNNLAWYEERKPMLEDYARIKPEYDKLKAGGKVDPTPTPQPTAGLSADEARKLVNETIDAQGPAFLGAAAWFSAKSSEHYHTFHEVLPVQELLANPKLGKPIANQPGRVFSLDDAYRERYGEKLTEHAKQIEDQRIDKLVQERLQAERAKMGPMPFPLRSGPEPSVLDVLAEKPDAAKYTADSATAEYLRLQEARGAA